MVILNLIISENEQIDAVVNSILKNQFAINVRVGNAIDSYHLNPSGIKVHAVTYTIQFVTKSLLFREIENCLKKEFTTMDFIIYAAPAVHIDTIYYDKIRNGVPGLTLLEKELL